MCKWGTDKKVTVIRRANPFVEDGQHEIYVDECLADEIQELNDKGIITTNSCCGHGKQSGTILIADTEKEKCEKLGYIVNSYEDNRGFYIYPRTQRQP